MSTRRLCWFDQCETNKDHTLPEPTERRYMGGRSSIPAWYWFCVECAEQIDAEAEEVKKEGRYHKWNNGYDHLTGEEIEPDSLV